MISLKKAAKIMGKGSRSYSDGEVSRINDVLQALAEIEYDIYKRKSTDVKGHNIHQGFNQRTS